MTHSVQPPSYRLELLSIIYAAPWDCNIPENVRSPFSPAAPGAGRNARDAAQRNLRVSKNFPAIVKKYIAFCFTKDKAAGITGSARTLFSARNAEILETKDLSVLDEYLDGLADIAEDLRDLRSALIPAMKSWTGGDAAAFAPYEQRLAAVSRKFDGLPSVMQRFWASSAQIPGSARTVQARIWRAAAPVETPYVLTALEGLESLIARHYDALDGPTKARVEAHYLQTLELTLEELGRAEQGGEDPAGKAALCLRAVGVVSQVLSGGGRARREQTRRNLEAEVTALERLAALRGDVPGGAGPEA